MDHFFIQLFNLILQLTKQFTLGYRVYNDLNIS